MANFLTAKRDLFVLFNYETETLHFTYSALTPLEWHNILAAQLMILQYVELGFVSL